MPTKKSGGKFKKGLKGIFIFPMSARRQFRRLMATVAVLFVAVVSFHLYFFRKVETQNVFEANATAPVEVSQTVNEKKLTMILQRFDAKTAVRTTALTAKPLVLEPSK